ncbi:hypothetical protein PAMP_016911 [Pampus punctatissimus]
MMVKKKTTAATRKSAGILDKRGASSFTAGGDEGGRLRGTQTIRTRWRGTDKEKGHRQKQVANMAVDR